MLRITLRFGGEAAHSAGATSAETQVTTLEAPPPPPPHPISRHSLDSADACQRGIPGGARGRSVDMPVASSAAAWSSRASRTSLPGSSASSSWSPAQSRPLPHRVRPLTYSTEHATLYGLTQEGRRNARVLLSQLRPTSVCEFGVRLMGEASRCRQRADNVAALLRQLGVCEADVDDVQRAMMDARSAPDASVTEFDVDSAHPVFAARWL